ncbi:MAG TPA: hypothetical protein VGL01_16775 [Trinickia sp.]|uniref:hypothetical protein n=1 Tax=Trinickia sp. TaxID=2571163 RepID=UPI002F3F4B91
MTANPLVYDSVRLVLAGLVSAALASWFQNRDHRFRKYWELKVAAYQAVIEALSDVEHYYDEHFTYGCRALR